MNQNLRVPLRASAVLAVALMAFAAFAADPPVPPQAFAAAEPVEAVEIPGIDGKTMHLRPELMQPTAAAGMAVDLPSEVVAPGAEITLSARNGNRIVVSETIALPETLSAEVTVAFLANHGKELRQLRNLAKARPGTLHFTIAAGDRVIADMPFIEADGGSVSVAEGAKVVGSSREVRVNIKDPQKISATGMEPDPECESACNDTYVECYYVICDQRGDCSYCWEDYEYCVQQCPQICVEPKQVYEYGTSWQYSGSTGEYICLANWYRYILWTDWESRDIYERTVHCDNTYTDVYKRTETRYAGMCKQFHSYGCVGNMYNPPGNC